MYLKETLSEKLIRHYKELLNDDYEYYGEYIQHFYQFITFNELLHSFLIELSLEHPFEDEQTKSILTDRDYFSRKLFNNRGEFFSFHWHALKYLVQKHGYNIHHFGYYGNGFEDIHENIVNHLFKPITTYLEGKLNDENSINYVLNRYKRRVEWFFKESLSNIYKGRDKNYEEILDQDLKLYLFDLGLEYPISKPSSASGNADIIGNLDKKEAFILEIKIVDSEKSYGKNRILSGITQAYKYALDYSKAFAHLVIFNFDQREIKFDNSSNLPSVKINDKTIFLVTINMSNEKSASKIGKLQVMEIKEGEIFAFIEKEIQ